MISGVFSTETAYSKLAMTSSLIKLPGHAADKQITSSHILAVFVADRARKPLGVDRKPRFTPYHQISISPHADACSSGV
jgi:hypothetical protein